LPTNIARTALKGNRLSFDRTTRRLLRRGSFKGEIESSSRGEGRQEALMLADEPVEWLLGSKGDKAGPQTLRAGTIDSFSLFSYV